MQSLIARIETLLEHNLLRSVSLLVASVLVAWAAEFIVCRALAAAAGKTRNRLDDQIVTHLRRPIFFSVLFYGISWAMEPLSLHGDAIYALHGILKTATVLIWGSVAFRVGGLVLESLSKVAQSHSLLQQRTLPLFVMLLRGTTFAFAVYFLFLSWEIDVTAWLASAGIIGVVVGFAAQDTLGNLFTGIFIIADSQYRLGDFIVLEDGTRGKVTQIGFRSTRILTLDEVEITIPNSVIGSAKVANEVGGPDVKQRISVPVSAAYGSDVDEIRRVLLSSTSGVDGICQTPPPTTRFLQFGASGLEFSLQVWISNASMRDIILDQLHERVYKGFADANIEIPYNKHDLYIKEFPHPPANEPASL